MAPNPRSVTAYAASGSTGSAVIESIISNKPFIFTYFKDVEATTGSANQLDLKSLHTFQQKLDSLRNDRGFLNR